MPKKKTRARSRAAPAAPSAASVRDARHARFVSEFLVDLNASAAYRRAGFAAKDANVAGPRLLATVGIAAAVAAGKAAQLSDASLSAARVLEELRRIGFVNSRDFFDAEGRAKHPHQLTAEQGAALQSFDVVIQNVAAGDDHTDRVHKFKLADKVRALELLAKHFALLVERVDVTVASAEARVAILNAARARVKG